MNLPPMFVSDSRPTYPPAATAVIPNDDWIIGEALSRMPMPAVTFVKRTTQRNQNCGVRSAWLADTDPVVCMGFDASRSASKPFGFQSGCGSRMTKAPIAITTR